MHVGTQAQLAVGAPAVLTNRQTNDVVDPVSFSQSLGVTHLDNVETAHGLFRTFMPREFHERFH
jgi:hypothetical protein